MNTTTNTPATAPTCTRIALRYLGATTFCLVFAIIYEFFSFGVFSPFMFFQFLFPLLLGVLPFALLHIFGKAAPGLPLRQSLALGIATLTVGSCFAGVLEIYGTTSSLTPVFFCAGTILLCVAAALALLPIAVATDTRSLETP